MSTRLLPFQADQLRDQPLSYDEVGASLVELPAGYHHLDRQFVVGRDRAGFEAAAGSLLRWGVQRGTAGVRVAASSELVEVGAVAVVRLGIGPFAVRAPVRVVAVVDEPDRKGFAYGTLAGHPECGEESFVVALLADGTVVMTIRAFSRPGSWLTKVGGPVGRLVQRGVTRGYGRALRRR